MSQREYDIVAEITVVEQMINELNELPHKTEKELSRIKFLRKTLGDLRNEQETYNN
jgi:hypothetical protein